MSTEYIEYRCGCGGVVKVILKNSKIYSCNIRKCISCKKRYYSKGILKLDFISGWRETNFTEYANLQVNLSQKHL